MVTAVGAAIASKERIPGPVVGPAICVQDPLIRVAVQVLVAETAQFDGSRPLDVGFVYVQNGCQK